MEIMFNQNYNSVTIDTDVNNNTIRSQIRHLLNKLLQNINENSTVNMNIPAKSEMIQIINLIADIDDYDGLNNLFDIDQMQELWKIILYTVNEHSEYGKPFINIVYDDDVPSYIDIMFPNCNWDEWGTLEKE